MSKKDPKRNRPDYEKISNGAAFNSDVFQMRELDEIIGKRIIELVNHVIDQQHVTLWTAELQQRAAGTVPNWLKGLHLPRRLNRRKIIEALGADPDKLALLSDEDWSQYLQSLPKGRPPKVRRVSQAGIHSTAAIIQNVTWPVIEDGSTIWIIDREPRNYVLSNEWKASIKTNRQHGIHVVFVTVSSQRVKDDLSGLSARMLSISLDDLNRAWTDTIIIIMKPTGDGGPPSIESFDIVKGYEHLYGPGEKVEEVLPAPIRPVFAGMTPAKLDRGQTLLKEWVKTAEWM